MTANDDPLGAEPKASRKGPQIVRFAKLPAPEERHYLALGLGQPGGKGHLIHPSLVHSCLASGWVEPWFANPLKPDCLVCKLTEKGRRALGG